MADIVDLFTKNILPPPEPSDLDRDIEELQQLVERAQVLSDKHGLGLVAIAEVPGVEFGLFKPHGQKRKWAITALEIMKFELLGGYGKKSW